MYMCVLMCASAVLAMKGKVNGTHTHTHRDTVHMLKRTVVQVVFTCLIVEGEGLRPNTLHFRKN